MKYLFAPGCALILYKPHLVSKLHAVLKNRLGPVAQLLTCCRHTPSIPPGVKVINICPGCDRRYRENYDKASTISLWELMIDGDTFDYPDYKSQEMTIIDACPTRNENRIHEAVRALVKKMNITLVEPRRTRRTGSCCGDTFFDKLPTEAVKRKMKEKAAGMPCDDIVVYCVSCSKSMFVGGKKPRYLIDLLFDEDTIPKTFDPDLWHRELDLFIEKHKEYELKP